jgi:hypothetical protein
LRGNVPPSSSGRSALSFGFGPVQFPVLSEGTEAVPKPRKEITPMKTTKKNEPNGDAAPSKPGRFALGQVVSTPGALEALSEAGQTPIEFLARHAGGDWGTVDPADAAENELSVKEGFRILSAYTLRTGVHIWIITEADRSSTCILLPTEY